MISEYDEKLIFLYIKCISYITQFNYKKFCFFLNILNLIFKVHMYLIFKNQINFRKIIFILNI